MKNDLILGNNSLIGSKRKRIKDIFMKEWQIYLLALPAVVYVFIFSYIPMYGALIAFKDYKVVDGILGSEWVGLKYFIRFFKSHSFNTILTNTLVLSFMQLIISFPMPIILALLLNQVNNHKFKRTVQTVTYAPHFISIVVLVGMLNLFLSPSTGIINVFIKMLGGKEIHFMGRPDYFRWIYVLSGVWQNSGYGAIIYFAALSSINPNLYESAQIDGCSKLKLIRYIDIPHILPTAIIMLILQVGRIMELGFQKAFLMQNALNLNTSEIISTYVYKVGLVDQQYSYSTAIGLFNSVVNVLLLVTVNTLSKKLTETSLW